jgi:cobalt-zinc-cadmium efflux system outer membrane protein
MKYIFLTIVLFAITNSKAQNNIDNLLANIAKNNKAIIATQQYWEAKKLLYKTGINPSNPKIEYEYMAGPVSAGGNQTDISAIQSFDFPTAYIKKNQVSNRQITQSDFQMDAYRQDILLKAKQYCLELVYLNKKQIGLNNQVEFIKKIHAAYQLKLVQGDVGLLDVNKIKLQLFSWENELRLNTIEIKQYTLKLSELNGGTEIIFSETTYPITPIIPDFTTLESTIEENDPNLKAIHQQNEIDQKKLELSRAMALPKLEGGYRSQNVAGQTLQGIHLGITIPLWENKNKVKHQKAHLRFNDLQIEEHQNKHLNEIQQLYEKYLSLSISIAEYEKLMDGVKSNHLLDKALALEEISFIQYIMEINYFYDAHNDYLNLEKEYNKVIAELYKYQL